MEKKELICRHSVELFAKDGFLNTTVQMIADAANISVGTIYNYFSTKEDILDYIFKSEYEKRLNILSIVEDENIHINEKINVFLDYHFEELEKNSATIQTMIQESISALIGRIEWIEKTVSATNASFVLMLDQAKAKAEIRELDSTIVASFIISAARDITYLLNQQYIQSPKEKVKRELRNFILYAVLRK